MCILCVIQKWSRRVAMMLPWLVIPLIGLWALSQLLPPAFRFEITSPRLACVFVLLVTLFWYEILMPQLSAWRVRRNARLRERKRFEAIELQKLRKTATRRCRNCLTPYRDQNPGGGRFMCSYCGHISKRPVLDLPVVLPGMGISSASVVKELVGKSGKLLNGKNGWMCAGGGQDWPGENGNWEFGKSSNYFRRRNGSGVFGGDEDCLAEKSYSGIVIFACRVLTSFFSSLRWIWRKVFRIDDDDEESSDAERKGLLSKRGENGSNFSESRGEKARRKAEEKRQARLEKELLEEEERKQREEVAKLVEERRRRLRDEKTEAEKASSTAREKDRKKDSERRRHERKKEKDKSSSKSNSDAEELEKKSGKDSEKKRDFFDRRDFAKGHQGLTETGHGFKNVTAGNNFNRGNSGTRYFDRMRGTILSSSKAFSGGSFFGRGTNNAATMMTKEAKPNAFVDHNHISAHRKDIYPPERVATRPYMNGDDKNTNHMIHSDPQPDTAPKKSWQQLFTRSPNPPQPSTSNVISRPNSKLQQEPQNPQSSSSQSLETQSFDNPINFGSPFSISTYPNTSRAIEPMFPRVGDRPRDCIPEEPERFEDPCYIPDPSSSLLGPISASLEMDFGLARPRGLKNVSATSDANKPSPIESPLSREKHNAASNRFSPRAQETEDSTTGNETGMWQMWNTCPLGQDGLGLVGGPASWILPPELSRSIKDEPSVHHHHHQSQNSQRTMASLFMTKEEVSSNVFLGHGQNHGGGSFSPVNGSGDSDPWLQKGAYFPPLASGENQYVNRAPTQNEMIYGSPFEQSSPSSWPNKEWTVPGPTGEGVAAAVARPQVGGLFPAQNVQQSLWSFD